MSVILWHATPRRNVKSIRRRGLLASKSLGKLRAVWLHTASNMPWAVLHTAKRHRCPADDVIVIAVRVGRQLVRRGARRGLWYSTADVPADRLGGELTFNQIANGR